MTVVGIGARKKEFDIPTKTARKIAPIIKNGIHLKQQQGLIKLGLEENNRLLIPHAENLAGISGQKKIGFKSPDGMVEVTFSESLIYNEKDIPKLKKILGPLFEQVFSRETTYAVNVVDIPEIKELLGKKYESLIKEQSSHKHKPKLRDMLSDGDSETAKKLRDVITIEPKNPAVKYETVVK